MPNARSSIIRAAVLAVPAVRPYLSEAAVKAMQQFGNYQNLRDDFFARIYDSVDTYMLGAKPVTLYKNSMVNLIGDYHQEAVEMGYMVVGGELPLDDATQAWITSEIAQEIGNARDLFNRLKAVDVSEAASEALNRANGYSNTLDAVYSYGKLAGLGNRMLTLAGPDGKENCKDCRRLKGKWHRASWWKDNEMQPGMPGNDNYQCGGWNCEHYLVDKFGNKVTV